MSKSITEYVKEAHANAVAKGFTSATVGEELALIHSEVSEALEDFRTGRPVDEMRYQHGKDFVDERFIDPVSMKFGKPIGFPSELADILIRVFDLAGKRGIDLERALEEKLAYNATRPFRHGGKVL